jgi:hypothetical protein
MKYVAMIFPPPSSRAKNTDLYVRHAAAIPGIKLSHLALRRPGAMHFLPLCHFLSNNYRFERGEKGGRDGKQSDLYLLVSFAFFFFAASLNFIEPFSPFIISVTYFSACFLTAQNILPTNITLTTRHSFVPHTDHSTWCSKTG